MTNTIKKLTNRCHYLIKNTISIRAHIDKNYSFFPLHNVSNLNISVFLLFKRCLGLCSDVSEYLNTAFLKRSLILTENFKCLYCMPIHKHNAISEKKRFTVIMHLKTISSISVILSFHNSVL